MAQEINRWVWPNRSAEAELKSLTLQADKHIRAKQPDRKVIEDATNIMLGWYPKSPAPWAFLDGKFSDVGFDYSYENAVKNIEGDSSPGMPFATLGCAKNVDVLQKFPDLLKKVVKARLRLLSETEALPKHAVEIVMAGFCDPVRVFVKNEPHNPAKVAEGRLRLISSVSLVDQMCERILYGRQNAMEIANWDAIPSKPGMGLDDASIGKIFATWKTMANPYEADISGWDFSMQWWEMLWEADFRAHLIGMTGTSYHTALRARAHCEMWSMFMLSDGRYVAQGYPGKRCSGSYNTSTGNSRARVLAGLLAGSTAVFAMGDDSLENTTVEPSIMIARYKALGHVVKMFEKCEETSFEFCSTRIGEDDGIVKGVPQNWARSTYRLLYATSDFEGRLDQYRYEMRWHPRVEELVAKATALLKLNVGVEHRENQSASGVAQNYPFMPPKKVKKKKNNNMAMVVHVPQGARKPGPRIVMDGVELKTKSKPRKKPKGSGVVSMSQGVPIAVGSSSRQRGPLINQGRGFNVKHTEFLDTIPGSVGYSTSGTNQIYNLNPGLIGSFPWLGSLGGLFESYMFHKLIFRVISSSSTTDKGNMYMATQLDVEDAQFTGEQDLMGYMGAVSSNVWKTLSHSCLGAGKKPLYVRTGSVPAGADPRLYDYGRFTLATEGCASTAAIGKLYVEYDVTLYTPKVTLAGALNFWKSWYTATTSTLTTPAWVNSMAPTNMIQNTTSSAPEDYVVLAPGGDTTKIQFNYPGLYSVQWDATTDSDSRVIGRGFAAHKTSTGGTGSPSTMAELQTDGNSVVTNLNGVPTYSFQITPRWSEIDQKTNVSTPSGFDTFSVDYVGWSVQLLVLAAGAILTAYNGNVWYGQAAGSTASPSVYKTLAIATLNLATAGLTLSMLPAKMELTEQAKIALISRVAPIDRIEVARRVTLVETIKPRDENAELKKRVQDLEAELKREPAEADSEEEEVKMIAAERKLERLRGRRQARDDYVDVKQMDNQNKKQQQPLSAGIVRPPTPPRGNSKGPKGKD